MPLESPWSHWGNVPVDGDVVPASLIPFSRGNLNRQNKRHHFVSVAYATARRRGAIVLNIQGPST